MDAGNRAASVAAELLAFYREPALVRTRYLHGEDAIPDGALVFRMALGRFASGEMDAIPVADRGQVQVAAIAFVRQVCLWERASHYQVLGLESDAAAQQVRENYHLLIALIHPDRHEADWPAGSAPRVNLAYAVLSDDQRRSRYDENLGKAVHDAEVVEGMRSSRSAEPALRRHRYRRSAPAQRLARFAVVAGVVAALFMVQAWWLGAAENPQYSLLEHALPATERLRDALPDPPRFLGSAVFNPGEQLPWHEEPKRVATSGPWVPAPEARPMPSNATAPIPARAPERNALVAPPTATASPRLAPAEGRPTPLPVASAHAAPPPLRLTQSSPAAAAAMSSAAPSPSREQVEGLVALLVSYYDGGDAERLLALYDPDQLGFWSGMRTRSAYADFFGATRERRLRIERLSWQTGSGLAQARGEAIVMAEYQDGRPRLERRVPVELDIVLRDAQPRITRMVLFPLGQ